MVKRHDCVSYCQLGIPKESHLHHSTWIIDSCIRVIETAQFIPDSPSEIIIVGKYTLNPDDTLTLSNEAFNA